MKSSDLLLKLTRKIIDINKELIVYTIENNNKSKNDIYRNVKKYQEGKSNTSLNNLSKLEDQMILQSQRHSSNSLRAKTPNQTKPSVSLSLSEFLKEDSPHDKVIENFSRVSRYATFDRRTGKYIKDTKD